MTKVIITPEHMDDDQKRDEKLRFALQFIDNAKEQLNDLKKLRVTESEQRHIDAAFAKMNAAIDDLKIVYKPYSLKAQLKEILNESYLAMHRFGGMLNTHRRPKSPHRDPV